jgi:hypothetical protein
VDLVPQDPDPVMVAGVAGRRGAAGDGDDSRRAARLTASVAHARERERAQGRGTCAATTRGERGDGWCRRRLGERRRLRRQGGRCGAGEVPSFFRIYTMLAFKISLFLCFPLSTAIIFLLFA